MHPGFSLPPDALARMEMFREATNRAHHLARPEKLETEQARYVTSSGFQNRSTSRETSMREELAYFEANRRS